MNRTGASAVMTDYASDTVGRHAKGLKGEERGMIKIFIGAILALLDFTVTNVEKTRGSEYDTAKEGYEYVIVSIKIENKSEEKITYNPYDWKMENSNGQEEEITFTTTDSDTELSSGNLNAGGVVEGTLAFEQPQGDTGLKLNYYNNSVFDEDASFKIKLD